jgi:hypothetical protein
MIRMDFLPFLGRLTLGVGAIAGVAIVFTISPSFVLFLLVLLFLGVSALSLPAQQHLVTDTTDLHLSVSSSAAPEASHATDHPSQTLSYRGAPYVPAEPNPTAETPANSDQVDIPRGTISGKYRGSTWVRAVSSEGNVIEPPAPPPQEHLQYRGAKVRKPQT